jgi:hypothetical protein
MAARHAVAVRSAVRNRPALLMAVATVNIELTGANMDNFELEPNYTSNEVPGKCLKCLAEKELNNCLFSLLDQKMSDLELQQRYEALLALLQSPDLERLRSEAERLLSEGKQVKVKVNYYLGKIKCDLITE